MEERRLTFEEIMDEELARKLHAEFERESYQYLEPSQEERDFLLALELSQQTISEPTTATDQENQQLSEDYLLALNMQTEWENQQANLERLQNAHVGNVFVSSFHRPPPDYIPNPPQLFTDGDEFSGDEFDEFSSHDDYYDDDDSNDDSDFDEEYIDEYDEFNPHAQDELSRPLQVKTTPGNASDCSSTPSNLVSKHDLKVAGKANTKRLQGQVGINSGNIVRDRVHLSNQVYNQLNQFAEKSESKRIRRHGKEDHETREGVMDNQTRLLIYKLINQGVFKSLGGIINSGKESNVYRAHVAPEHSTCEPGGSFFAVKIYKTTLNEFKNRDEYISEDHRFRSSCKVNKQNPRKFIRLWAEKESENLARLARCGILCPKVVVRKNHVLVMSFLGVDRAAPQLKHLNASSRVFSSLYFQACLLVRRMFQQAKLVHADLSEYNLLYFQDSLYVIDVAQAVDLEHPNSMGFLQRDCDNITKFFLRKQVFPVLTTRELLGFVTDSDLGADQTQEEHSLTARLEYRSLQKELTQEELHQDEIWKKSFLPRSLADVTDPFVHSLAESDPAHANIFSRALTDDGDSPRPDEFEPPCQSEPAIPDTHSSDPLALQSASSSVDESPNLQAETLSHCTSRPPNE